MIFPGLTKPLSLVILNCWRQFWCYHRIASEQILITDVMKCGTQQQSLLSKPICEFHWACEVNSKQVILWMAMSSQHCCLDLFLFCFLFKMPYEYHMLSWAGTNIQGFHHLCHCHHSTDNIFSGLCSSTPWWENDFLNFIHVVFCLVKDLFLKETVVSKTVTDIQILHPSNNR